ncbi:LysE family translocator [Lampropedia puyangensis]|uniref:LysE family translocator n=1 Tax=Lampropedia puyangensis TaxID=1330072 RepID=A0A4V4GSB8_9BURK|nr:LysE family translocator [Lampropedia puyangensis]THU03786.1 LysE family translocator [Lampropedia puyangensis]
MPAFEILLQFFGLAVLLALTPGPDNIFVLIQSAQHGLRTGLLVVVGLCIGVVVHTCAVALGLAAVVAASSTAFMVLKLLGAAYLAWLAWGAWHAPCSSTPQELSSGHTASTSSSKRHPLAMVGRGMLMNLSNPKVLMFFLAFLPQFADPNVGPIGPQIAIFGALFAGTTLLVFGAIACFSGFFGHLLQRSVKAQRILNRLASIVFIALAARLATLNRT